MRVDFEVTGADLAARDLAEIGERAADAKPALRVAQNIFEKGLSRNFSSEGSYFGAQWEPNAPGTLAKKARLGQGAEVNVATGATREAAQGGAGRKTSLRKTSVRVGLTPVGAIFAQRGTKYQPKRKVVGLAQADRELSVRMVERYVVHGRLF